MPIDLLHFGSGIQALHYAVLCYVAIIGTLQAAAAHYEIKDLVLIKGKGGIWIGATFVACAIGWFLIVDEELFTPGLAGGELFVIFAAAFMAALPSTRAACAVLSRVRALVAAEHAREEEPIL